MALGEVADAPGTADVAPRPGIEDEGRTIRRRRPVPGPRAAVGGFLVAVAVVGTFATVSGATQDHRVTFVVARDDLAVGDRIEADDLVQARLDVPDYLRARAFRAPRQLVGATVLGPVARGELVQAGSVRLAVDDEAATGQQVSFPVEAARALDGRLQPGERVDILVTYGQGESATTEVVARGARIARVRTPSGVLGDDRTLVLTLTVAADTDATAVAHAAAAGSVTVVRVGS